MKKQDALLSYIVTSMNHSNMLMARLLDPQQPQNLQQHNHISLSQNSPLPQSTTLPQNPIIDVERLKRDIINELKTFLKDELKK